MIEAAYQAAVEVYGCKWSRCQVCFSEAKAIVKCSGCRLVFCSKCDEKQHSENPFCHRTLHFKESERWIKSQSLLPTQFLNCLDGSVESKGYTFIAFIPCVFFIRVSNLFSCSCSCPTLSSRSLPKLLESWSAWRCSGCFK